MILSGHRQTLGTVGEIEHQIHFVSEALVSFTPAHLSVEGHYTIAASDWIALSHAHLTDVITSEIIDTAWT